MVEHLDLGPGSLVVEVGSNDGYLLQHFQAAGVPVLGIDPASNVARAANAAGIPTRCGFFGMDMAKELVKGQRPNLICGTNVLAHVPDLHDFVAGLSLLIAPGGTITMEFPWILHLIDHVQFDTIYHEHYSYFSLHAIDQVFRSHALAIHHVDYFPTHGGSIRIHASRMGGRFARASVAMINEMEEEAGLTTIDGYTGFQPLACSVRRRLLRLLIDKREAGRGVAGYGAPAKGNTLLNFCGIDRDLLPYVIDDSPHKQGHYLPGSHIPVMPRSHLAATKPKTILILPWNLADPIIAANPEAEAWGAEWVCHGELWGNA
jgi:hypothetical protein